MKRPKPAAGKGGSVLSFQCQHHWPGGQSRTFLRPPQQVTREENLLRTTLIETSDRARIIALLKILMCLIGYGFVLEVVQTAAASRMVSGQEAASAVKGAGILARIHRQIV